MSITRITFSPHTADPGYVGEVALALMAAQLGVASALWSAQIEFLHGMLDAQWRLMESVQAAIRPV